MHSEVAPDRRMTGTIRRRNGRLKWALRNQTSRGKVSGIMELAALARLAAVPERRFGNRESLCPYKRPYNSGTTRIRLLPFPSVMGALTCGKLTVGSRRRCTETGSSS